MYWVLEHTAFLSWHPVQFIKYLLSNLSIQKHVQLAWDGPENKTDPVLAFNAWLWATVSSTLSFGRKAGTEGRKQRWWGTDFWISAEKCFWIFYPVLKAIWLIHLLRVCVVFISPLKYNFWLKQTEKCQLEGKEDDTEGYYVMGRHLNWAVGLVGNYLS